MNLLAKRNSKKRRVLPLSTAKSSYACCPQANAATPCTMGSLMDLSLSTRGDDDCELLKLPCRIVHISRHPEADHTAKPLFPHPTANARLSGVQATCETGPVSSTVYLWITHTAIALISSELVLFYNHLKHTKFRHTSSKKNTTKKVRLTKH